MSVAVRPVETPTFPAASLDRRFYAFVIDRLLVWTLYVVLALLAYRLIEDGSLVAGVLVLVVGVLLLGLGSAVLQGLLGFSPGKLALGLRVVHLGTGTPLGVVSSMLRTLILGAAALPTFGLGLATLAWTALSDRDHQRRGWHDHASESIVVDVRPVPVEPEVPEAGPRHIVNLTAMRLVPAPQPQPQPQPASAPTRRTPIVPLTPVPNASPYESTRVRSQPPVASGDVGPVARWRVAFDTGEAFLVEGLVLVGRRPEPRPGEPVRHLVALPSSDMSLSKTHAQLQVAPDGVLVATDRGSTNGSILVRSGVARELAAGTPTTLLGGDLVRFGDRQMTVVRES